MLRSLYLETFSSRNFSSSYFGIYKMCCNFLVEETTKDFLEKYGCKYRQGIIVPVSRL
ncbi:uncharacterized protein LOC143240970 isoform X4 [Tachypleus tridentatus]|uniref:uncharacterized protein LOC143240970 isoform X4 n=1 Tax=Tachypleus tridentatus TaxID=6853 RepID=UPI003FD2597E